MAVLSYIAIIPSTDLEKSLRFWAEGLGLAVDRHMRREGKLIGCMVHNEHVSLWLNETDENIVAAENYKGIRLYWSPNDLLGTWKHLKQMGFPLSEIEERDYGQTEFFVTDNDGFSHCFGIATKN